MKKTMIWAAAVCVVALAACNKEMASPVNAPESEKVTICVNAGAAPDTKVIGALDSDNEIAFTWESEDRIKVTRGGLSSTFSLKSGAGSASAVFEGTMPGTEGTFDVQFPVDEPALTSQDYAAGALPHNKMKAAASGCTLDRPVTLTPSYAALRLNLYGTSYTVSKIVVTNISSSDDPQPSYTLSCGTAGVDVGTDDECATPFFIVVPSGEYQFAAEVYDNASTPASLGSFIPAKEQIFTAGKILNMPAKEVSDAELIIAKTGESKQYVSLAEFRDATNGGTSYDGYTVALLRNIDLKNEEWTPISNYSYCAGSDKIFKGTFDGGNHTICNLKVSNNTQDALGNTSFVTNGFFGQVATCTIRNLKFENANVNSESGLNAIVAALHTVSSGKLVMDNVQVLSGSVSTEDNAGGLMAFNSGWSEFRNCVNYASVTGAGPGGIVGILCDNTATNSCIIADCTNYGTIAGTEGGGYGTGGITSKLNNAGSISGCRNYGEVTATESNVYCGGIAGVINPGSGTVTVTDCINYADICSNVGDYGRAGGMVGSHGGPWSASRCINTGDITGYQGAGGINGYSGDSWGFVAEYCYNSGTVTCSNGTAGGIDQGGVNQTVKYSLNNSSVSCGEGKYVWQIGSSPGTITSCYYYDGTTLKANDGTAADVDEALTALNNGQAALFWGKDSNNIIKPVSLME